MKQSGLSQKENPGCGGKASRKELRTRRLPRVSFQWGRQGEFVLPALTTYGRAAVQGAALKEPGTWRRLTAKRERATRAEIQGKLRTGD